MEENKKLDLNSIIGFILIFGILIWIMYQNQPTKEQIAADKAKKEQAAEAKKAQTNTANIAEIATTNAVSDTLKAAQLKSTLGNFAYSAALPTAKDGTTTLENDLILLKIANKGGYVVEAKLKKFEKFKKNSGEIVSLVKDNNANLNLQLVTNDNKTINTKDLFFEPIKTKVGDNQVLTLRLKVSENEFLEYKYVLKPNNYMIDFDVRSQGLNKTLNTSKPADLEWNLKTYRNEKSVVYEDRYTDIRYEYENGKDNNVSSGKDKEETPEKVTFVAFKQHFFSTIYLPIRLFQK